MKLSAIVILLGLSPLVAISNSPHFSELQNLKPSQTAALHKFRKAASAMVSEDYMKEDIYLVKFLQFSNFNVRKSVGMLADAMKWRKQVKVDQWENPGFFDQFERNGDYPIFSDGFDRKGRPVVEGFFGDWNIRAVAVSGKIKQFTYYLLREVERANFKIREIQAQGKNITQFIFIVNMDGFSVFKQACPSCIPLYLGYLDSFEKAWPNTVFRLVFINTPDSFELILNLVRQIMSPQLKQQLRYLVLTKINGNRIWINWWIQLKFQTGMTQEVRIEE